MISFEDFQKLDLRTGKISEAKKIEGADKLLKLIVDIGEEQRQIVAGIAEYYSPQDLKGKQIIVLCNLEPKEIKGVKSEGMLLAVDSKNGVVLIVPEKNVNEGEKVR